MLGELARLFTHLAQARGAHCELKVTASSPTTRNDPAEVDYVEAVVQRGFPDRWSPMADPVTASEDFAYVLEQIPGAFVFVSAVPEGTDPTTAPSNHSPQAIFDDSVLDDAARLLAELALGRLAGSS
jgi:hippurate hydrolase